MWNKVAAEALEWLKGIAVAEAGALVAKIRADPEKFANDLLTYLGPLVTSVTESEIRTRRDVYESLAAILGQAFSLSTEDTFQWILAQVKDEDLKPDLKRRKEIEALEKKVPSPLVARVSYRRLVGQGFERVDEAIWQETDGKAKRANSEKRVTWDEMPADVQQGFLRDDKTEITYQLIPRVT